MADLVRLTLRWFFGLMAAFMVVTCARAAIPATQGYTYIFASVGGAQPTEAAAVAQYLAPRPQFSFIGCAAYVGNTATCQVRNNSSGVVSNQTMVRYPAGLVCPANATLSGSNCSCNSGYVEEAGACVLPPDPGAEHCASINGSPVKASWVTTNPSASNGTICMINAGYSCTATVEFDLCGSTGNGLYLCHGSGVSGGPGGGTTCTPSPEPDAPPPVGAPDTDWPAAPPPGTCPGQVNGVNVNVPCSNTTSKGTTTTTTDDGAGNVTSKSESKATVCNAAGSCTTTVTTTTSVNGGTPSTTTTSTTEGKGEFCASNRGAKECGDGDGSSFGGSCEASFTCTGDAVQCALTKEVHLQNCKINKATDEGALYTQEKGRQGSVTGDLPGNETIPFGPGSFDDSDALGGGACISDLVIAHDWISATLPFSMICPHLAWLRQALLAIGALAWMLIVFRR